MKTIDRRNFFPDLDNKEFWVGAFHSEIPGMAGRNVTWPYYFTQGLPFSDFSADGSGQISEMSKILRF